MLIKAIETAGSYPAKINCSAAQSSYRDALADKFVKNFKRTIRLIKIRVRKACYQAACGYFCFIAYMYYFIVKRGAAASFCKKEFIHIRVVNRSKYDISIVFKADAYATNRNSVCKVYSSVNRVNYPFV